MATQRTWLHDMTAGTLCAAANELKSFGALRVFAFASHGLFNGAAAERIEASALEEVQPPYGLSIPTIA